VSRKIYTGCNHSLKTAGDDRLRLYSASSSRRYSIPAGVKAIVCWSPVRHKHEATRPIAPDRSTRPKSVALSLAGTCPYLCTAHLYSVQLISISVSAQKVQTIIQSVSVGRIIVSTRTLQFLRAIACFLRSSLTHMACRTVVFAATKGEIPIEQQHQR
jgi:hypothetical protein